MISPQFLAKKTKCLTVLFDFGWFCRSLCVQLSKPFPANIFHLYPLPSIPTNSIYEQQTHSISIEYLPLPTNSIGIGIGIGPIPLKYHPTLSDTPHHRILSETI